MTTHTPIRIAVVGLGWVGKHRHIPAIRRHNKLRLVGVIDSHAARAEQTAAKLKIPYHAETDRLSSVPWLDEIDAVALCTPPWTHHDLTLQAFERGKHVLTEKPFAMSLKEAESMGEAAQKAGKTLAVVHNFQFGRAMTKLDRDIKKGKLGTIRRVSAVQLGNPRRRLPAWFESLPLGLFYDESPHLFYLLHHLVGDEMILRQAHGVGNEGSGNTPRLAHFLYQTPQGLPVTIDCQFDSAISEWFVLINGENSVGLVDLFRDIYIRLPNDDTHEARHIIRTSVSAFASHFIQHIPNGLSLLRGNLDYGNDSIMDRFVSSIQSGQEDDKIGFTQAHSILKLQLQATKTLQDNLLR